MAKPLSLAAGISFRSGEPIGRRDVEANGVRDGLRPLPLAMSLEWCADVRFGRDAASTRHNDFISRGGIGRRKDLPGDKNGPPSLSVTLDLCDGRGELRVGVRRRRPQLVGTSVEPRLATEPAWLGLLYGRQSKSSFQPSSDTSRLDLASRTWHDLSGIIFSQPSSS